MQVIQSQPNYGTAVVTFTGRATSGFVVVNAAIPATANITVSLPVRASSNHTADEHWVEELDVYAGNIVAGVSFTIYLKCKRGTATGNFNVDWLYK